MRKHGWRFVGVLIMVTILGLLAVAIAPLVSAVRRQEQLSETAQQYVVGDFVKVRLTGAKGQIVRKEMYQYEVRVANEGAEFQRVRFYPYELEPWSE